jgi:outer membrane lipoprotein-sorting protein
MGCGPRAATAREMVRAVPLRSRTLLALLLLAGCAVTRPQPPVAAPTRIPTVAEAEADLVARRQALHGIRALAHMKYRDADSSGSAREAIVIARPDRLRVEVLSMFGAQFVLTTAGGRLTAYAPRESTVYSGAATAANLAQYARMPFTVDEIIDVVLATPARPSGVVSSIGFDPAAESVRLTWRAPDFERNVWLSTPGLPTATEERGPDGQLLWRATYGGFEPHAGIPLATRVALQVVPLTLQVELSLNDLDVNPVVSDQLFALSAPPGARVVRLDAAAP